MTYAFQYNTMRTEHCKNYSHPTCSRRFGLTTCLSFAAPPAHDKWKLLLISLSFIITLFYDNIFCNLRISKFIGIINSWMKYQIYHFLYFFRVICSGESPLRPVPIQYSLATRWWVATHSLEMLLYSALIFIVLCSCLWWSICNRIEQKSCLRSSSLNIKNSFAFNPPLLFRSYIIDFCLSPEWVYAYPFFPLSFKNPKKLQFFCNYTILVFPARRNDCPVSLLHL